jgi:hypothetical protein
MPILRPEYIPVGMTLNQAMEEIAKVNKKYDDSPKQPPVINDYWWCKGCPNEGKRDSAEECAKCKWNNL